MPSPGAALLLVRLPDIGVPMRAATPGPPPSPRTPEVQPLPVLATAMQAITGFLRHARAGVTVWHA